MVSAGQAGDSSAGGETARRERPERMTRNPEPARRGLVRARLVDRLTDPDRYKVALVVAPAGSGKSVLIGHCAGAYAGPVAWCGSPGHLNRSETGITEWLWASIAPHLDPVIAHGPSIASLADALDSNGPPLLVVVDDFQALEGSEGERVLGELLQRRPRRLRLLLASRVRPGFDMSQMRVSGDVIEFGPEDLRFRAWEVEALYEDVYSEPLLPEEVALLARRTAGWAAYLQMFHLASGRMSRSERRMLLARLASRPGLVQDYLARHVLAGLEPEMQEFLMRTGPLRNPTPALCDELVGTRGTSAARLADLERRNIFTERLDPLGDSYRYHPVLVAHLDTLLVETLGSEDARKWHARAASVLEAASHADDALPAYARAEDWQGVARLLAKLEGRAAAGVAGDLSWIDALPTTVVEADSMLLLARARAELASGSLELALGTIRRAESVAGSEPVAARCHAEAERLSIWARPDRVEATDWCSAIRAATQRDPAKALKMAAGLPGPTGRFAEGMIALLVGDAPLAGRLLRSVASRPDVDPVMGMAARLGAVAAGAVTGRHLSREEMEGLLEEVEATGVAWIERMAQVAVLGTDVDAREDIEELIESCQRAGDRWGEALIAFLGGVGQMRIGKPALMLFERAAGLFSVLGAGVLEAVALAHAALDRALQGSAPAALALAAKARTLAAIVDSPGTVALASMAAGLASSDPAEVDRARQLLEPMGLWNWHMRVQAASPAAAGAASGEQPTGEKPRGEHQDDARQDRDQQGDKDLASPARLRVLGELLLELGGDRVDESCLKPRERALLHMLASKAGEPIHRDVIIEALWPEARPGAGVHRLQVAVSALRRLLGHKYASLVRRDGESYRLALPGGSEVDIWELKAALQRALAARASGDRGTEISSLEDALVLYDAPLLPSDGSASWVAEARAELSAEVARAASRLSEIYLADGELEAAARTARRGLGMDRYRDDLWQVLIEVSERSGRHAEAGKARQQYAQVLSELGI
jgi:DNA-binding SARP family transcriptional activator